jgi:hypothetical protein
MRVFRLAIPAAAAAMAVAAPLLLAQKQGGASYSVGVGGGIAVAEGALGDRFHNGYALSAEVLTLAPGAPIGIRLDGMFNHFGGSQTLINELPSATGGSALVYGLMLDAVLGTPKGRGFHPYGLVGFGLYMRHVSVDRTPGDTATFNDPFLGFNNRVVSATATNATGTETVFGTHFGGGVSVGLGPVSIFVETRYHVIHTDVEHTHILPFTAGLRF